MATIGRGDLGSDAALADNAGRVARVEEIDAAIGQWTLGLTVDEVLAALDKVSVPAGRIYTVADIAADPHYQARGMLAALLATVRPSPPVFRPASYAFWNSPL